MLQDLHVIIIKIHPNLNPINGLVVLRRDKPKTIDMLGMIKIFTHQIEDYICIKLIFILLCLINWEDKPSSILISNILPFRLDILLEIFNRIYYLPLIIDEITIWDSEYLCCLFSLLTKKWSRLLSLWLFHM